MSPKSIAILMALGTAGAVAVALTIMPPSFDVFAEGNAYLARADFDGAFAEIEAALISHQEVNPVITAADREGLRQAALRHVDYVSGM